jgi:hypothetical protein
MIRGGYFGKNKNAGQPDIFGILKNGSGRLFGIEVKNEIGKLSDEQKRELKALEDAGALIIVSRNLEKVIEILTLGERDDGNPKRVD